MNFSRAYVLPLMLVAILLVLQYRLWFEPGGILHMLRLKKELTIAAQQNELLKQRNEKLLQQVKNLHQNGDVVETHARQELGMVKKDETFYQVVR